jgi:hypothetical protein
MAEQRPPPRAVADGILDWGVAVRMLAGESAIGDAHVVVPTAAGMLVAVIDGLGHGAEAARQAELASGIVRRHPDDPLPVLVQRCHDALTGQRGVVMSLASFSVADRTMAWVGIGDVAGVLVFQDPAVEPRRTALIHRGGIVGVRLPQFRPWVIPLADGDTLIFATDGLRSEFETALPIAGPPQAVADDLMDRFRKASDDALVLVARFQERGEAPA